MEIINTLGNQIAGWKALLAGEAGNIPSLPFLKTGAEVLLGLLVLFFIAYRFRTHQLRRERKMRYRIARMIAHLCDTYDSLEDVDWKKQKVYRYQFVDGDLKIQERDIDGMEDLIGPLHPGDALKYTEEYLKGAIEKAMKTCCPVEFTAREKGEDGVYHWKSFLFQGIKNDKLHRRSCLLLKRGVDDSHSQEMEKRAQLSLDMNEAREAAQAKSEFLNRFSQDTREALRDIMGNLTLTKDEVDPQRRKEYMDESQQEVHYLMAMIEDVKELSDIENGNLEICSEEFNVDETLEKMNQLFQKEAEKQGISYSCTVEPLLYPNLIGDEKRLEQVLLNLLTHALLFTDKGQKVLCAVRQKLVKNKKVAMEFTVLCAGMKVPQEMVDKAFLPFELTRQVGNARVHGGLGLVVTQRLVQLLGGQIKADNAEGRGMRYIIELPFAFASSVK
ncbi:HAMP domain-containing sensor histidine kinase [uncultured Acidaminococcus sp.]|uniref:sensor histidine kinase n=1 Tax=uncultured Acidaminococcus sp. TaxID=352152 RepID=UPI002611CC67|nr:HAMP domain-containing sensor histidine kinase [uncultured Acidaminococcus sp.]